MQIKYFSLSSAGFVHKKNEDSIGFWQPDEEERRRNLGAVMVLADGVGGQGDGEIASRMAVNSALEVFTNAKSDSTPSRILGEIFDAANIAIYDAAVDSKSNNRMATTLTISVLRNNEVTIGHVGDCRVYHIHGNEINRITSDHSYSGVQLKLGLINVQEAAASPLRCVLTRSVGQDPIIRPDYHTITVHPGDFIVHCCDGLYTCMTEQELYEIVTRWPEMACIELHALAERRGADDNLSVQIVQVQSIERVGYYRGLPTYRKEDLHMGNEVQSGALLDGRYQIGETISKSGMATIYKATDLKENRTIALKIPHMQFESDPNFFTRFKREEEIGSRLRHPYLLHIEPPDPNRSRMYLVMEYLEGQTLGHLMRSVRPMPVHDALKITSLICEAIHYMHDHDVVHRDLKPDNVMICNDGSIRIMDFGIAKSEGGRRLTFGGFQPAMGTPDYMAPEQVRGKRGDPRTDIYSLGAILYEMVTGFAPFEGANPLVIMNARVTGDPIAPRKRNPEISPQVEEIILHAMARDPADRYSSAIEMKEDLDHPEKVKVTGRADRLQEPSPLKTGWQRHRLIIIAIAIPIIVFLIFFVMTHVHLEIK